MIAGGLQVLIDGLAAGAVCALLALALVLAGTAVGALDAARGGLLLLAGVAGFLLVDALARRAAAGLGLPASPLPGNSQLADLLGAPPIRFGALAVTRPQLAALAAGALLAGLVLLAVRHSRWGLAMRALAEDRALAALSGIRPTRVAVLAWLLAGLLAGVAALLQALPGAAGPAPGPVAVALLAVLAALLGGLESIPGAVAGGLLVGLVAAAAARLLPPAAAPGVVGALVLPVLLVRPAGLGRRRELAGG